MKDIKKNVLSKMMPGSSQLKFSASFENAMEPAVIYSCYCCRNKHKFAFNIPPSQRRLLNNSAESSEVSNYQIQVLLRIGRVCEKETDWDKVPYGFRLLLSKIYIPSSKSPINLGPYIPKLAGRKLIAEVTWNPVNKDAYVFNVVVLRMKNCDCFVPYVISRTRSQESLLITNNMETEELEVTSQNVSLLCPLTRRRIEVPVQGRDCNHSQCFDAVTFFSSNLLNPKWVCPVCLRPTYPQDLVTDGLWRKILHEASTDLVSVRSDGSWTSVNTFVDPPRIEQCCE